MSTLCIYGCGTYTDEPDDICKGCKGFSSIKKIKTSPQSRADTSISPPLTGGEGEGDDMSQKKQCDTIGCKSPAQKDGKCYRCFKAEYGKEPYPIKAGGHRTCKKEGCKKYPVKKGLCTSHWNEEHGIIKKKSQISSSKKPVPINKQCSVKGCGKYKVRNRMCIGHDNESLAGKSHPSSVLSLDGRKTDEPEIKNVIPADPFCVLTERIQAKDNGKNLCLGQLLYSSGLLDKQINSALEDGSVDTKVILNIRFRLGEVLRGSLPGIEVQP